jgi:glycerophosphoryl diester phosphodiesterase
MISLFLLIATAHAKVSPAKYVYRNGAPTIVAHRGACGYLPEHTLAAYEQAVFMGADFIEPDIVPTRDGILVVNHMSDLNATSNVSELPIFANKLTRKQIPSDRGVLDEVDWYIEDFDYAEILMLKRKQRFSNRPQDLNGKLDFLTLGETLDYALHLNKKRKDAGLSLIGVYIEPKTPGYFMSLGFDVLRVMMHELSKRDIASVKDASKRCPIILQCFELDALERLAKMTDLPLVYLVNTDMKFNLTEVGELVHGLGPEMPLLFDKNGATPLLAEAHKQGLVVHPWVGRDDKLTLKEAMHFYKEIYYTGVDGVFTEFPNNALIYFNSIQSPEVNKNFL